MADAEGVPRTPGKPASELWRNDPDRQPNGSWPPFEKGNLAGARSGAWSPRLVSETMEQLRPELQRIIDMAPWCRPIDEWALTDYLRDVARLERLEVWLEANGDRYPEGHKSAGELRDRDLREVASLRRRCMDHRSRLGLDPVSRSRLSVERKLVTDTSIIAAEILEAERQRALGGGPGAGSGD